LHNDKDQQILFAGGPNTRTTNPKWRTAAIAKKLNRYISALVRAIAKKFGSMTHIRPLKPIQAVKILKNPRWRTAAILKTVKQAYIGSGLAR